jgi:hypothetical protein
VKPQLPAVTLMVAAVVALLAPEQVEAQCAMCRTALASPEGQKLAAALRSGILLLFAAPFTIFGTVAYFAVRAQRRRQEMPPTPDVASSPSR